MTKKRTNIEINMAKLNQAKKISGIQTTKDMVDFALDRLISSSRALKEIIKLEAKVKFYRNYNYKESR